MKLRSNRFVNDAANPHNKRYAEMTERQIPLYLKHDDIRTEFARDYTRILHSLAYRRLKRKTQVFFNTHNDHVCTRIEHVNHVESVSYTISKFLGLDAELTKAIAVGHDLGHAPFGHQGEEVLKQIALEHAPSNFWHEKNGLYFVDKIELLEDDNRVKRNMNLTYAVRDGIISHCGEVDDNGIFPRDEKIDLYSFDEPGKYQPFTWEGCVVKISDKIAYIGRDIEDAQRLKFIGEKEEAVLAEIAAKYGYSELNTSRIMHELILNLCENSSPEDGLLLSERSISMMNEINSFNYEHIYKNKRFEYFKRYTYLILTSVFDALFDLYDGESTVKQLKKARQIYPQLAGEFADWLVKYCDEGLCSHEADKKTDRLENVKIYGTLADRDTYAKAILDYISGMTDQYAISMFDELTTY